METIERAAEASPPHARRRRPRRWKDVCAPKRRAFRLDDGAPVDAAHALTGSGIYEYGCRPVHRKKLPGSPPTEDKSWYFAFDPHRRGEPNLVGPADGLTPTHAMLQAIVWEKRFVRCTIDGEPFTADLTDAVRERTGPWDTRALRGPRRPDVSARAVRAPDRGLNGRPLDVEIAVTNGARTYERIEDLLWSKRACVELYAERDEALEADAELLEEHVRAQLLAGTFVARWLVAPDGAKAQLKTIAAVQELLAYQRALAEDELSCARGELDSAHALLEACAAAEASGDRDPARGPQDDAALARVAAERDALLAVVEAHHRDRDATSLVWMIAERIMPSLRERRLRTRALRMAAIRTELCARFPGSRSGLMRHVEALDRAMQAPMSDAAVRRAEAESLVAIGVVSMRHAEERLERVAEYSRMLDELESAGARQLLFPPRTSLRATIAYEYLRRFGAAGAVDTPLAAASGEA